MRNGGHVTGHGALAARHPARPLPDRAGARVHVVCGICRTGGRDFTIKRFIEQIKRAGTGSAGVPADQLSGALIRGSCAGCGVRHWMVRFTSP